MGSDEGLSRSTSLSWENEIKSRSCASGMGQWGQSTFLTWLASDSCPCPLLLRPGQRRQRLGGAGRELAGASFPPRVAARRSHRPTAEGPPARAAGGARSRCPAATAVPAPGRWQRARVGTLPAGPRVRAGWRALSRPGVEGLPGLGAARGSPGAAQRPFLGGNGPLRYRAGGRSSGRSVMKRLGLLGLLGAMLLGVSGAGGGQGAALLLFTPL